MLKTDSSRAPDWRWQKAIRLANNAAFAPGRSDELVIRVGCFLKCQRRARTSEARARLQEKCPTIATVQLIRFDPRDGRRDAIEVRLLAGYPPWRVAELGALDPAVVWTYLALFFDIGERLHSGDFIRTRVIGLQRHDEGGPALERRAMLWLAWNGGPQIANALLLPGRGVGFAERYEDIDDHLKETTQALIARAMALAPLLDRLDHKQARQFTRWLVHARQQRAADNGDVGQRRYLENIEVFLEKLEFSIGRSTIPNGDDEKYYTSHVEPRAAEWAAIRRGEPVPDLDAKISSFTRPPENDSGESPVHQQENDVE